MSLEKFTNNAITTLGSAVAPTSTSITLSSGSGALFPSLAAGQYFTGTMFAAGSSTGTPNEIVKVTARIGDTLTVVRGQEGTSASSWGVGDTFANFPTAAFLNGVVLSGDVQIQSGNSALDTGAANQGIIVLDPAVTNLSQILLAPIRVKKVASANTGAYTLIVNGLTAKPVTINGQSLAAGQLVASQVFEVVWDGTNFELISTPAQIQNSQLANMPAQTVKANPGLSGDSPSDVLISDLASLIGFGTGVLAEKGYFTLPIFISGEEKIVYVQWGKSAGRSTEGDVTTSFQIPFPTACLGAVATAISNVPNDTSNDLWAKIYTFDQNSVTVNYQASSGGNPAYGAYWIAIGY
jgi:hypothetical protein